MINAVIIASLLICFGWWELLLQLSFAFAPRKVALNECLRYEDKAISLIFSMFRTYTGFRIQFENRLRAPLPRRFLIVANHQSLLDIPVIMHILPKGLRARFVAKQELAWGIPLISLLLRKSGHCLVRRNGAALQAMRSIAAMAARCRTDGTIPVIFPEGTRSRTGALGTFHSAGYRKILEVDPLPILVVAVDGGWKVAKLKDFFRSFGKTSYTMRFLDILPKPKSKKEALALLEKSRLLIEKSLEEAGKAGAPDRSAGGL